MPAIQIQKRMTSREIKIKNKSANVAGLQFADLFANPACYAARMAREQKPLADSFGSRLIQVLDESKYRRWYDGTILGYGLKWLP
jgi:hypothetical protein